MPVPQMVSRIRCNWGRSFAASSSRRYSDFVNSLSSVENFIAGINDVTDVMVEWREYVAQEKERQLTEIIRDENLKENETRQFMEIAFRDGAVKTTGTDIDKLLPPMSRFGGGNRAEKKQGVIAKLLGFFERFFGIG